MMSKMEKLIEKYEGKTVRVAEHVYVIHINEDLDALEVILRSKYDDEKGDEASSNVDFSDYKYVGGGRIYKLAVQKAKEIAKEFRMAEPTDF